MLLICIGIVKINSMVATGTVLSATEPFDDKHGFLLKLHCVGCGGTKLWNGRVKRKTWRTFAVTGIIRSSPGLDGC